MKIKNMSLMALSCLLFALSVSAGETVYRKAAPQDLPRILAMIHGFDQDDQHRLVTFPKEIEQEAVLGSIHDGIYLAFDRQEDQGKQVSEKLISMVKLYVIAKADRASRMKEVGARGPQKKLLLAEEFTLPPRHSEEAMARQEFFASVRSISSESDTFEGDFGGDSQETLSNSQVFIYYGGAYTERSYRKQSLQSKLLKYGMTSILAEVLSRRGSGDAQQGLSFANTQQLVFVYGQVQASSKSRGAIFDFAHSISQLNLKMAPTVLHLGYYATKPNLFYHPETRTLSEEYPIENQGIGHLVVFTLAGGEK